MFRRNRWNHFVRIRYASWRRHSSKFRNNSNRRPRMPITFLLKASTPPSTASWTRAVTPCFQRHLALSVSGSCRTGVSWVGHKAHPRGVRTMAVEPCGGSPAQGRSPRSGYQHDLYAQVRAFGHAWHRNGGRYEWRVCFRQVQPSSETEKSRKRPTERQNDSG